MEAEQRLASRDDNTVLRGQVLHQVQTAQTAVGHPGWQFFLEVVEAEIQKFNQELERQIALLAGSNEDTAALTPIRLRLRRLDGYLAGLKWARDLLPRVIQQGEVLTKSVTIDNSGQS